jgi:hypothetical protein
MLSLTLEEVDRTAVVLKAFLTSRITSFAAGSATASAILDVYDRLGRADDLFAEAASTSGIAAYAKTQKDNETLDVVAEFQAMRSAISAARTWIVNHLPTVNDGGTDYLALWTLGTYNSEDRTFAPAGTAGLRTAMQAVVDTIG